MITLIVHDSSFNKYNIKYTQSFMQLKENNNRHISKMDYYDDTTVIREQTPKKTETLQLHLNKTEYSQYKMFTFIYKCHNKYLLDNTPNAQQPFEDPILHKIKKNQPLQKRPKRRLLCDGEIYNYNELIDNNKFTDIDLQSNCDKEIILPLYIKYGIEETLNLLNGEFSCIITENTNTYELNKIKIYAARDRYGLRPLWLIESKDPMTVFYALSSNLNTIPESHKYICTEIQPGTYWSNDTKQIKSYIKNDPLYKNISSTDPSTLDNIYSTLYPIIIDSVKIRMDLSHSNTNGIVSIILTDNKKLGQMLLLSIFFYLIDSSKESFKHINIYTCDNDMELILLLEKKYPLLNWDKIHYHVLKNDEHLLDHIKKKKTSPILSGFELENIWNNKYPIMNRIEENPMLFNKCINNKLSLALEYKLREVYVDYRIINYIQQFDEKIKQGGEGNMYIIRKTFDKILIKK